jgi:hypothetical protein
MAASKNSILISLFFYSIFIASKYNMKLNLLTSIPSILLSKNNAS